MSDAFPWTISLGRWAGVSVRLHITLVLFCVLRLLGATLLDADGEVAARETLAWLGLLLVTLAVHELGHAAAALRLGGEPDDVRLWPLGNFAVPRPVSVARAGETFLIALAGPLTNFAIAVVVGIGLAFADVTMVINPFGHEGSGAPLVDGEPVAAFGPVWWIGWFGYLNWVLFLANMIPALPMDAGRMLRAALAGPALTSNRDGLIAPWTARSFAVVLALGGIYRLFVQGDDGGLTLILLAVLFELMVRLESRMFDEGGEFEDSLFGYDFSEGYTSLEGSGPKVRPYRESALSRWRRRRSEARRARRAAKELADERRMDEILIKIHASGRESLSDEEQRFLLRVSSRYKNRTRTGPGPGG